MRSEPRWGQMLLAGAIFGVPMGAIFGWAQGSWLLGAAVGTVSGMLFAAAMGLFASRAAKGGESERELFGEVPPFDEDETVLREGLANHFKGIEGVGGKLYLTGRRLRFISHKLNIQRHDESYPLSHVSSVKATRTLGIIPNGLVVCSQDGQRERFVVYQHRDWEEAIQRAVAEVASGSDG